MRARQLLVLAVLALSACAPPHRFEIRSDEPMKSVQLELANSRKTEVKVISPRHAIGEVHVSDSSGEIRVTMLDGRTIICPIGYITNGEREPHNVTISSGRCDGV